MKATLAILLLVSLFSEPVSAESDREDQPSDLELNAAHCLGIYRPELQDQQARIVSIRAQHPEFRQAPNPWPPTGPEHRSLGTPDEELMWTMEASAKDIAAIERRLSDYLLAKGFLNPKKDVLGPMIAINRGTADYHTCIATSPSPQDNACSFKCLTPDQTDEDSQKCLDNCTFSKPIDTCRRMWKRCDDVLKELPF